MRRYRKLRPPVLSRLTLAWLGSLCVLAVVVGAALNIALRNDEPERVALRVDEIEYLARPEKRKTPSSETIAPSNEGLRLTAPDGSVGAPLTKNADADRSESLETADAQNSARSNDSKDKIDVLNYPAEDDFATRESGSSGEVIITIAGGDNTPTPPISASLSPIRTSAPIPDPTPALTRATPLGAIPRIAADGRKPYDVYAHPHKEGGAKPRVALLLGGLGLNRTLTERAITELPPEISLAFAPYAKDLDYWTKRARDAGHEVVIELPMEGHGANQEALGAAALLSNRATEDNLQRLEWLMSRFGGYFAATNYLGAKLSTNTKAMTPILSELRAAGVAYIDDTGAAEDAAIASRVAAVTVNRVIPPAPNDRARSTVQRELKALETAAKQNRVALGKTYAYAATIDEIDAWAATLHERGVAIAPASAILQIRPITR